MIEVLLAAGNDQSAGPKIEISGITSPVAPAVRAGAYSFKFRQ